MKYIAYILFALVLASCTPSSAPIQPVYLHGDLEGYVRLVELGPTVRTYGGIKVIIEGTDRSAFTDDRGHWSIPNLTTGTYTIRISRDSFGYVRVFDYPFVGGGLASVPDVTLIEASTGQLYLVDAYIDTLGHDNTFVGGFAATSSVGYAAPDWMVVVMDTDSVRIMHQPEYSPFFFPCETASTSAGTDAIDIIVPSLDPLRQALPTAIRGRRAFARVAFRGMYRKPYLTNFYDPNVGRTIYSGTGQYSNVISVRLK